MLGDGWGRVEDYCRIFDTLRLAREMHPGQRNSLDALCKRYEIENAHRTLHGALLDAELLADVYLAMTGGQSALGLDTQARVGGSEVGQSPTVDAQRRGRVISASADELVAHQQRLFQIDTKSGGACRWLALEDSSR
jgi:DNA polymerase III subunit epsilon